MSFSFAIRYYLTFLALYIILRFVFRWVNGALLKACTHSRIKVRVCNSPERSRQRQAIRASRFWFVPRWLAYKRKNVLLTRRVLRRIHSASIEQVIGKAYLSGTREPSVTTRIRALIHAKRLGDGDAVFEVLCRRVQTACYTLVSPKNTLNVGMYVGIERPNNPGTSFQLVLGMESWMLLLWLFAGEKLTGWKVFAPLRSFARMIVREGITHELIHVLQDMDSNLLMHEFRAPHHPQALTWSAWAQCEAEALLYGSPLWLGLISIVAFWPPLFALFSWAMTFL